jgi:hypothetical protein
MNEESIANIFRATRPVDNALKDGWLYACLAFARALQVKNGCFNALAFVNLCGISGDEEHEWLQNYDESGGRPID